ncbi:MAG: hypothetical protein A2845_00845 [Candidatus Lloydbacteria bacterium RIFCSPHIGHO2_01_FULL_49_22]|uniref:Uncharacterized protein n=1 Tax=Candidatus Lloydbacteria bacterium RIFCSPHIGHO2_01_FULL_49_22 TaxID=1798658 RepID=A0A1G2D0A9_9BACT|nr:MAG: hypothetical protein A2845_00845 [Candidatus Lloydbacteria bacterium RIFCSPHIGHO2_01_FULL_49_22]OGZ09402.1 MAG: hypothetical protein A3C14_05750 [Candidatus Lloydbacteria bacterium RIFCSPHIGHO2_02_FULL_50_18]
MEPNEFPSDELQPSAYHPEETAESADLSLLEDALYPEENTENAAAAAVVGEHEAMALRQSERDLSQEIVTLQEKFETLLKESEVELSLGASSLDASAHAFGLDAAEKNEALETIGWSAREQDLRERLHQSTERLAKALREGAGVVSTAFVLGISTPAYAETPTAPLESLTRASVATETGERSPLPSYEEVKEQFRASALIALTEERAVFVRTKDGEPMKTMILTKGKSVSVGFSDTELKELSAAMKSSTAEIEDVHTHPINALKAVGLISGEDADKMVRGELAPASAEPSSQDWNILFMNDETYNFPPGQMSQRVIDATGEWTQGISDSGSPFIVGMRKGMKELKQIGLDGFDLTADEKAYLEESIAQDETSFHALQKIINSDSVDPLASATRKKLVNGIGKVMSKYVSLEDVRKYSELTEPRSAAMNREERKARVLRMEELAPLLGFRLKYTPHEVPPDATVK